MVNPPRRYIKISAAFRRSASLADYPTSTSHPTKFISCKSQSLGSPMFNTLLSKDPQLPCEEVYSLSRRKPCTTSFGQQWFHRGEKMITSLAISSMLPQEIHTTPVIWWFPSDSLLRSLAGCSVCGWSPFTFGRTFVVCPGCLGGLLGGLV